MIRVDKSILARLASGSDPAWSFNGAEIAYASGGDIWVMGSDGSGRHPVTNGSRRDEWPSWRRAGSSSGSVTPAGARGCGRKFVGRDGPDDWIHSRDGAKDLVTCGWGDDRVVADRLDLAARDCEHVRRQM